MAATIRIRAAAMPTMLSNRTTNIGRRHYCSSLTTTESSGLLRQSMDLNSPQFGLRWHSSNAMEHLAADSDHENDPTDVAITKKIPSSPKSTFQDITPGIPIEILRRLGQMGIEQPTPIQEQAIPRAMSGHDIMGLAQTGTGKTLAFGIPLIAQMMEGVASNGRRGNASIRGLVLAPTRELANQIGKELENLSRKTPISTFVVVGGVSINTQTTRLRKGVDILVATPGRLIDLVNQRKLSLGETQFLVLDEADQMTDMGFLPDLKKIESMLPSKSERQTMLFSATMSKAMDQVASAYLNPNPVRVEVAGAGQTADKVTQELHYVEQRDKLKKLTELLSKQFHPSVTCRAPQRSIVFGRTKHGVEKLSNNLNAKGFRAVSIHGNKSQSQRESALAKFKSAEATILVATDVAARGLDIPNVTCVYNYELPNVPEAYIHRIGRTARAGKEGAAVSLCSMAEMDDLLAIQELMRSEITISSGNPWSRQEAAQAKEAIKNRSKQQQAERAGGKARRQAVDQKRKSGTKGYGKKRRRGAY